MGANFWREQDSWVEAKAGGGAHNIGKHYGNLFSCSFHLLSPIIKRFDSKLVHGYIIWDIVCWNSHWGLLSMIAHICAYISLTNWTCPSSGFKPLLQIYLECHLMFASMTSHIALPCSVIVLSILEHFLLGLLTQVFPSYWISPPPFTIIWVFVVIIYVHLVQHGGAFGAQYFLGKFFFMYPFF